MRASTIRCHADPAPGAAACGRSRWSWSDPWKATRTSSAASPPNERSWPSTSTGSRRPGLQARQSHFRRLHRDDHLANPHRRSEATRPRPDQLSTMKANRSPPSWQKPRSPTRQSNWPANSRCGRHARGTRWCPRAEPTNDGPRKATTVPPRTHRTAVDRSSSLTPPSRTRSAPLVYLTTCWPLYLPARTRPTPVTEPGYRHTLVLYLAEDPFATEPSRLTEVRQPRVIPRGTGRPAARPRRRLRCHGPAVGTVRRAADLHGSARNATAVAASCPCSRSQRRWPRAPSTPRSTV